MLRSRRRGATRLPPPDYQPVGAILEAVVLWELVETCKEGFISFVVNEAPAKFGGPVSCFVVGSVCPDLNRGDAPTEPLVQAEKDIADIHYIYANTLYQ